MNEEGQYAKSILPMKNQGPRAKARSPWFAAR